MQVHAGRVQYFYNCWLNITNNSVVLDWIHNGFAVPFCKPVYQTNIKRISMTSKDINNVQKAITNLLELGAITPCFPSADQFISPIFLVEKPNGGHRFILNLKSFNSFVKKEHFKMEDYRTAAKLIPQNGFLATIDLKESYLLIPISKVHRKYLRFEFQPRNTNLITYEFTAMPYGLSSAPRVFTKIMKEVVSELRGRGFQSVIYLDDILCLGDTYEECCSNVDETLRLLQCLGFVINFEKSLLSPQQTTKFLGFIFNTQNMTISLPDDKRKSIAQLVNKFMRLPTCSIRDFAQLIGVLVAACPAVKYGFLYTKILERQKYLLLHKYQNYETKVTMPQIIMEDLKWWSENIYMTCNNMRCSGYAMEIYTDASSLGWGAVSGDHTINGRWRNDEKLKHINYLELLAVFLGLKSFASNMSNCAILLRVDNTTAICYVNRMGGIQFPHLNNLSRCIWQWCEKRNIFLFASYVNTKENIADAESRVFNPDTEWELSDEAFAIIVRQFGQPQIDLFASRSNAKCNTFVSWKPDPEATVVDAFTVSWDSKYFYAFPPFAIVLKCIRKIIDDKADGIFVFPYWPSQPWFPLLKKILASDIWFFNPHQYLLQSHFRNQHPLHDKLTLGAARVCGSRLAAAAARPPRSR